MVNIAVKDLDYIITFILTIDISTRDLAELYWDMIGSYKRPNSAYVRPRRNFVNTLGTIISEGFQCNTKNRSQQIVFEKSCFTISLFRKNVSFNVAYTRFWSYDDKQKATFFGKRVNRTKYTRKKL